MNQSLFERLMFAIAIGFTIAFLVIVVPPLLTNPDIVGAFAAGFVNPYASGYSTDVIMCWLTLAVLVIYDSSRVKIPYRWACLALGVVPGVAVGLPLYLVLRNRYSPLN